MRKTRIVLFTALLLVGAMLLSSCGFGGELKLEDVLDGEKYEAPPAPYTTATLVTELQDAECVEEDDDLMLFEAEVEVEGNTYSKWMVYNLKTNAVVFSATETETVSYDIDLDSEYEPDYAMFWVLTTTYEKVDGVVDFDKYTDVSAIYAADGTQIASASRYADYDAMADLIYFDGKVYRIAEDGSIAYAFDYSPLAQYPNYIVKEGEYYLGEVGYDEDSRMVVFDLELNTLYTLNVPSYMEIEGVARLDKDTMLLQGYCETQDIFTENYDVILPWDGGEKANLYTYIMDLKKGELKEIEVDYFLEYAEPVTEEFCKYVGLSDKFENFAVVCPIQDRRIDENSKVGVINAKGEFVAFAPINGQEVGYIELFKEDLWLIGTAAGADLLVNAKGEVVGDITNMNASNAEYLVCDGKLYDYTLNMVYDYEAAKLSIVRVFENSILFTNDDGELICYANGTSTTLIAKDADRELSDVINVYNFFVIFDYSDLANIKFEIYNAAGVKILTLDFVAENFEFSDFDLYFNCTKDEKAVMLEVTSYDILAAEFHYAYYRLA